MRVLPFLALTVLASATFSTCVATAGEALNLTPPLFREQARGTQQVRSVRDLTTTPQPVVAAESVKVPRTIRVIADAEGERAR